ncbi:MAG: purine-nucleoside phosphorylase [Ignavibacteria bacterium]|nr:purine-nucleoside phosphorylase [Ignavibacteria bacterium]
MKKIIRTRKHEDDSLKSVKSLIGEINASVGIILGTGLGGLVSDVKVKSKIDYRKIKHFPLSTVESHHGFLIHGEISGKEVLIMQGRFHYYEGYAHEEITYPVRIMKRLGVEILIVSNACGGLNPVYNRADLMIMKEHINFHFDTPLKNFHKRSSNKEIYDENLINLAEETALENKINIHRGVYLSLHGPCLETRAEYRMLRRLGADVVGMSTMPEATLASYLGIRVLGISIITDMGLPDTLRPAVLSEILEAASEAEPKLTLLTRKIIEKL